MRLCGFYDFPIKFQSVSLVVAFTSVSSSRTFSSLQWGNMTTGNCCEMKPVSRTRLHWSLPSQAVGLCNEKALGISIRTTLPSSWQSLVGIFSKSLWRELRVPVGKSHKTVLRGPETGETQCQSILLISRSSSKLPFYCSSYCPRDIYSKKAAILNCESLDWSISPEFGVGVSLVTSVLWWVQVKLLDSVCSTFTFCKHFFIVLGIYEDFQAIHNVRAETKSSLQI